jgi:hypothetical protein
VLSLAGEHRLSPSLQSLERSLARVGSVRERRVRAVKMEEVSSFIVVVLFSLFIWVAARYLVDCDAGVVMWMWWWRVRSRAAARRLYSPQRKLQRYSECSHVKSTSVKTSFRLQSNLQHNEIIHNIIPPRNYGTYSKQQRNS